MMIQAVLGNLNHPEYGVATIPCMAIFLCDFGTVCLSEWSALDELTT